MLQIPPHILAKLSCVHCGGYLSNSPIMVNTQTNQICGRCYKLLPDEIKSNCIRQIGLEAVAELFVFPCRYNPQGCTRTFPWNKGQEHESKCPLRYNSLEDYIFLDKKEDKKEDSNELVVEVDCATTDAEDDLQVRLNLRGDSTGLLLANDMTNEMDSVSVDIELLICTRKPPAIINNRVSLVRTPSQRTNPISPTLPALRACNLCNLATPYMHFCVFGHVVCKVCRKEVCALCGATVSKEVYRHCKNLMSGCTPLFGLADLHIHEIDCEFGLFKCVFDGCGFSESLNNLNRHVVQTHKKLINFTKELNVTLNRIDQRWYFYCFGKLFQWKYYCFEDEVEFVVKYVGANNNAGNFRYEVDFPSLMLRRSTKCLGWNEVPLGKGVVFGMGDDIPEEFSAELRITQCKSIF